MIKALARFKVYVDRARWYMGFIQMLITIAIFFRVKGVVLNYFDYTWMLLACVILFVVIGFIDVKIFQALKAEQRVIAEQNPVLMEILDEVKKRNKDV